MVVRITIDDEASRIKTEYTFRKEGSWRAVLVDGFLVATDKVPEAYEAALNSIIDKIKNLSTAIKEDR
uniref:Uncharacterized protein n=1 Tax=viral metagenome TaxID=1070528 RepID=A0A6M3LX47_9ZZZZ